jgi:hypothetical protein
MQVLRRKVFAVAVVASMAFGAATHAGAAEPRASANLSYVTSIPGLGGTDLEFFSRTLATYKDASGEFITPAAPVERHFALVGNQTTGPKIVDITSPEAPYVVAAVPQCTVGQGDPQITRDGMLAAIAYQTSGSCKTWFGKTLSKGSALVDLADVYAPRVVGGAAEGNGSHNQTLHPSGKYLYISTSGKTSPTNGVPIYDISDPANARLVKVFTFAGGDSPHDIRFSADGKRAYMAGIDQFRIVNTENPENPVVISTFTAPGSTIGHDALITPDKRFLFVGDEMQGGGTAPCPGGAIYAYDLADEANPKLLGLAEAGGGPVTGRLITETPGPTSVGGCTSHVMDLNPDAKSLTVGWYTLGSRVFSFSSFYNADGTPKSSGVIAAAWGSNGVGLVETAYMIPDGANTWAAKQYSKVPGYIFSDDLKLGFYVTKIK